MLQLRAVRPYTIWCCIGAVSIRAVLARIGAVYWRSIGVANCHSIATPMLHHCHSIAIAIPRVLT